MGEFYEEDEKDFGSRIYDQDYDHMQAFEKNQIILGIDPDDSEETHKGLTKAEIQ